MKQFKKYITLLYFQICVDIIGLPVYFTQKVIIFENKSKFSKKTYSYNFYEYHLYNNE